MICNLAVVAWLLALRHASLLASRKVVCERSEHYKPPLSNKGGTKNKRQYTLLSGKRCIYKAKPHFTWCDINYAIITWKN